MAFLTNSLRHSRCGQSSSSSSPDSIAPFDGTSEAPSQQVRITSSEQADTYATVVEEGSSSPLAEQNVIAQPEGPHCNAQLSQVSEHGEPSHLDEWGRHFFSRTATAQPSETPQNYTNRNGHLYTVELPRAVSNAQVRQESALHEHGDHSIFDEFTNGDLFHDDAQTTEEIPAFSKAADQSTSNPLIIEQKPQLASQPLAEGVAPADSVNFTLAPATIVQQTQESSANYETMTARDIIATTSRTESELAYSQSQVSPVRATPTGSTRQQYSFHQYAQITQQSVPDSQLQPSGDKILRSPSVDSVIGAPRRGSEETASSLGGMDLSVKKQFAQQWNGRQTLYGNGYLTADAANATPVLLQGPLPVQSYLTQMMSGAHYNSAFPYNTASDHPVDTLVARHSQAQPPWLNPGWSFDSATSQALPSKRPATQDPQADFREREISHGSDNDELSVTYAPRHRPTSGCMTSKHSQALGLLGLKSGSDLAAPKPSILNVRRDAGTELSGDDDEDDAAAFSWKLPDFEVTYHPPGPGQDLHMAKVSTLGQEKNLVRSEILLTEDHHHDEIKLFLNVFLPTQQALETPDPQPAYAVINFHTISVMVLEVFVQYEIGDEMGRGNGFHGGNISDQTLHPSTASSEDEPTRIRSAQDADVDEIFFAVIDRWRAGLISGKGTLELIRGCQEFCDIALDVIHYVKEHGLSQLEPKKRKQRSDKGVRRGPHGGAKGAVAMGKTAGRRKADAVEDEAPTKKGKVNELQGRKKAKTEVKNTKPKPKVKSPGVTIIKR